MENNNRIRILLKGYLNGKATGEELDELKEYIETADNEVLYNALNDFWIASSDSNAVFTPSVAEEMLQTIIAKCKKETPVIHLKKRKWIYAAAVILLMIGSVVIYRLLVVNKNENPSIAQQTTPPDISPGGNKAVLTLADGSTIILEEAANGNIATQGSTQIVKQDGKLDYTASGTPSTVAYNTISTPRGGEYQVTLSDGSKVWLNAASSLRYPAAFTGNERKVELTGEAYFEVVPSSRKGGQKMPFIVNVSGKGEVEVLGTQFNINSYNDEATINTTLLEGSVKVTSLTTQHSQIIKPGEQAQLQNEIRVVKNINTDEIIAWKGGLFHFESTDLKTILRQFSRWYDVEVVYEGEIKSRRFFAIINRNSKLSEVLKALQANDIKFKIEALPDDPAGRRKKLIVQKG